MYIPTSPFLEISQVISAFRPVSSAGQAWKTSPDDQVIWFSKGRWALNELVLKFIKSKTITSRIVLIPEYFCDISLTPLRKSGINLYFYKINSQLEPDIDHLNTIIKTQAKPDILLFVHYFGMPLNLKPALSWCDEHRVLLIEDAAHAMIPVPGIGGHGSPVIYTPWKFFNLLEGALLVLPQELKDILKNPGYKKGYSINFWKWLVKRIIYTTVGQMKLPLHKLRRVDKKIFERSCSLLISEGSLCALPFAAILAGLEKKVEGFRTIRERNFRRLNSIFSEGNFIAEPLFRFFRKSSGHTYIPCGFETVAVRM